MELFNESVGQGPALALINVFPNPMKDEMVIEVIGSMNTMTYAILNAVGESLTMGTFVRQAVVNTESFPSGLYTVKVSLGQKVVTRKIVKQ